MRGEQADGCFETIGSNFVRSITEKNNCQRAVLGSRTNKLCFALLQGLNQIGFVYLCTIVDTQFLIVETTMPDFVGSEVNHHLLAFNAGEEGYLAVGLRHNATVFASLVIELQRGLAHGNGLRCGRHNDQRRIFHCHRGTGSERSDSFRLTFCRNLRDVQLYLGSYLGRTENIAFDDEVIGSIAESLVQSELIATTLFGNRSRYGFIAIEEFQGCGINHTLVLG